MKCLSKLSNAWIEKESFLRFRGNKNNTGGARFIFTLVCTLRCLRMLTYATAKYMVSGVDTRVFFLLEFSFIAPAIAL
jgi:hypothetical protein